MGEVESIGVLASSSLTTGAGAGVGALDFDLRLPVAERGGALNEGEESGGALQQRSARLAYSMIKSYFGGGIVGVSVVPKAAEQSGEGQEGANASQVLALDRPLLSSTSLSIDLTEHTTL